MANQFDVNLGYYNPQPYTYQGLNGETYELEGIGSSLKKAVKKVGKVAEKTYKKVAQKTLPTKVNKELSRAAKNPVVRAVAGGVAMAFGVPAILTAIGSTAAGAAVTAKVGAALSSTGISGTVAKTAASVAKAVVSQKVVSPQITKFATAPMIKEAQRAAAGQTVKATEPAKIAAALKNDDMVKDGAKAAMETFVSVTKAPEFVNTVKTMAAHGATPQQIATEWQKSETYKNAVALATQAATAPIIYQEERAAGLPVEVAKEVANTAGFEAGKVAGGMDTGTALKIGAAALSLLMLLK